MKEELKHIGRRIKNTRETKGITMDELASRCDVSGQHIGLIERGRSGISVLTLIRIASALGVTTDSLLMKEYEYETNPATTKDTLEFLFDGCTEDELRFFVNFIRLYREEHRLKNK